MSGYSGYEGHAAPMEGSVQECAKPDLSKKNSFQTFVRANIRDDRLTVDLDSLQSQGPGLYYMDNQNGCECGLKEARSIQVSQPGINFSGGYILKPRKSLPCFFLSISKRPTNFSRGT